MEVLLPENQEAQLNELAIRTGRGTDDLIREAVAIHEIVHVGFGGTMGPLRVVEGFTDQIARSEFIEEDKMDARVKRMLEP